ncbi:hypothetical protein K040078D81_44080 [Blautia hominis]|uniref:Class IIb bacteriocin, lactobin A/cerein 7B family n=1 Tax=Blautia hominis TaxID=2025493 RepID=A0ABQ0BFQ2_9FIRM
MNNEYFMDVIDTNCETEEVGPGGADMCMKICLIACGGTAGYGTLGAVVLGTAAGAY